jgi:hypothetical protein
MSSAQNLRDAILDNSALRDGLTDDEAQPLIDWGLALADEVGAKVDQLITWAATYRTNKGEAWTRTTLEQLNQLNRTLRGEDAAQISQNAISGYAQGADGLDNGAFVLELMKQLSPSVALLPPPQEDTDHGETHI